MNAYQKQFHLCGVFIVVVKLETLLTDECFKGER